MPAVTGVGALSPTGDVLDADGWTNKKTATVTPADMEKYLCLLFKISSGINRIDGKLEKRGDAELGFGVLANDLHDLTRSFRSFNTVDPTDHYTLRESASRLRGYTIPEHWSIHE